MSASFWRIVVVVVLRKELWRSYVAHTRWLYNENDYIRARARSHEQYGLHVCLWVDACMYDMLPQQYSAEHGARIAVWMLLNGASAVCGPPTFARGHRRASRTTKCNDRATPTRHYCSTTSARSVGTHTRAFQGNLRMHATVHRYQCLDKPIVYFKCSRGCTSCSTSESVFSTSLHVHWDIMIVARRRRTLRLNFCFGILLCEMRLRAPTSDKFFTCTLITVRYKLTQLLTRVMLWDDDVMAFLYSVCCLQTAAWNCVICICSLVGFLHTCQHKNCTTRKHRII